MYTNDVFVDKYKHYKLRKENKMTIIENFNKEETYGVSANTLVHGDCLEVMKCIKDKSIDLILCDPPYG